MCRTMHSTLYGFIVSVATFLTREDPNAKIKGSRDPLGTQHLWTDFGRRIVSNLTTQSNSVRGFTILILGCYFSEQLIKNLEINRKDALDVFLRFEQIAAYVRHGSHGVEGDIRGIARVRSKFKEQPKSLPISVDFKGFILGDQKVNGLWGLFAVPARVSGLLQDSANTLKIPAREFVEQVYLPTLQPELQTLYSMVANDGTLDASTPDGVFTLLSKVLKESFCHEERLFYGEYLRDATYVQNSNCIQKRFRELLENETDLRERTGRKEVVKLCEAARRVDELLETRLDQISRLEAVLAPAMSLFDFMLTHHGRNLDEVSELLKKSWGESVPNIIEKRNDDLVSKIRVLWSDKIGNCFDRCQKGLSQGSYSNVLPALLEWHKTVMETRGSATWVQIDGTGKLDVRSRGADRELPSGDELADLWRNGYFIDSLKAITRQLQATP